MLLDPSHPCSSGVLPVIETFKKTVEEMQGTNAKQLERNQQLTLELEGLRSNDQDQKNEIEAFKLVLNYIKKNKQKAMANVEK